MTSKWKCRRLQPPSPRQRPTIRWLSTDKNTSGRSVVCLWNFSKIVEHEPESNCSRREKIASSCLHHHITQAGIAQPQEKTSHWRKFSARKMAAGWGTICPAFLDKQADSATEEINTRYTRHRPSTDFPDFILQSFMFADTTYLSHSLLPCSPLPPTHLTHT